jgi:hypothetical protein
MPLLAALLTSLFGGLAAQIVAMFVKKGATAVTAAAAIGVCMTVLVVTFNTVVSPFIASMFSTTYGQFIGLAFPPIAGSCLAAIGTTWAACGLYKLKVATIKATASA